MQLNCFCSPQISLTSQKRKVEREERTKKGRQQISRNFYLFSFRHFRFVVYMFDFAFFHYYWARLTVTHEHARTAHIIEAREHHETAHSTAIYWYWMEKKTSHVQQNKKCAFSRAAREQQHQTKVNWNVYLKCQMTNKLQYLIEIPKTKTLFKQQLNSTPSRSMNIQIAAWSARDSSASRERETEKSVFHSRKHQLFIHHFTECAMSTSVVYAIQNAVYVYVCICSFVLGQAAPNWLMNIRLKMRWKDMRNMQRTNAGRKNTHTYTRINESRFE